MEEQTNYDSLANVDGDQRDTEKNEHLNNIVHEILDNLEFVTDHRKPDEVEKENENDNLLTLITGAATPCTQPGQEIESEIDEDNEKAFLEKCEPSKSPEFQYLEKDVSDNTEKTSESHQLEILESARGKIEMPVSQSVNLEEEMSNFEENNTNLSEQVENYETCTAEIIEDNSVVEKDEKSANKTQIKPEKEDLNEESFTPTSQLSQILENEDGMNGNCRKLEVSTEIRAVSKSSILENPILHFSL